MSENEANINFNKKENLVDNIKEEGVQKLITTPSLAKAKTTEVFDVNVTKLLHPELSEAEPLNKATRIRREKRPFSPDLSPTNKRSSFSKKQYWKHGQGSKKDTEFEPAFKCDLCGSNYILNPARLRQTKRKKKPGPRHKLDPVTKKILTLCNACGLAMDRPHRLRKKPVVASKADKEQYLIEATAFGTSVAEEMNEPEAEKLYCPSFKVKPCGCVQRFITGGDAEDFPSEAGIKRAYELLRLHREARKLKSHIATDRNEKGDKRLLRMMRAEGFERFILANRLQVRHEMGICERACQRLLFYSNNFLHKDLKTGPAKGPRIKRLGGKKQVTKQLKPICELSRETCCSEQCARLALSHTKTLELWRKTSQASKQGVRKVVAEMLTSNVMQRNCHKFITFVTGCSFSVISKVKEQMRRTQGQKEPPEHGMRRWWREHPKKKKKSSAQNEHGEVGSSAKNAVVADPATLHNLPRDMRSSSISEHQETSIPHGSQYQVERSHTHMQEVQQYQCTSAALDQTTYSQYLQSRAEFWQPLTLDCPSQSLSTVNPSQVLHASHSSESPPQSHTLTVLAPAATSPSSYAATHAHPSVIISVPEAMQGQAISVITPSGFEPLTPVPFVIMPESNLYVPAPSVAGAQQS